MLLTVLEAQKFRVAWIKHPRILLLCGQRPLRVQSAPIGSGSESWHQNDFPPFGLVRAFKARSEVQEL